jgi:hypothetical protein
MGIETALNPFQLAGAGLQLSGAYGSSKASKAAYEQQAQVARNNAQLAEWQAQDALTRGQRAASAVRMKGAQLKGTQRATMAANGVDLGVGSALRILADTDYLAGMDAGTALDNAAREAWAIRNQAAGFTAESNLLQSRADAEKPWMAAATSLLGSATRVAPQWYRPGSSAPVAYPGDGLSQGERRKIGVY